MIIYKLTSPSGKCYIGQTTQSLSYRLSQHKYKSKKGIKSKLYSALRKYPINLWNCEVICKCINLQELAQKEQFYIKKYNSLKNGYNLSLGGEYSRYGCKLTETQRKAISLIRKNNKSIQNHIKVLKEYNSLGWEITTPEGTSVIVSSLREFCKENNLNHGNMYQVAKKNRGSCKGYKVQCLH